MIIHASSLLEQSLDCSLFVEHVVSVGGFNPLLHNFAILSFSSAEHIKLCKVFQLNLTGTNRIKAIVEMEVQTSFRN